jgi:septal ring factor EnvC (AmiA/AmiB activator)
MWDEIMEFAARPSHGLTDSFKPASSVAASISVLGAVVADPIIAWSAAIAAVGTTLVPRLIDWYRQGRAVKLAADLADLKAHAEVIAEEIGKRLELEAKVKSQDAEIADNRHKLRDLEQANNFMRAELEALRMGQAKLNTQVKRIVTPDPDAPEPGTDEHAVQK